MNEYVTKDNISITLNSGEFPYATCRVCPVLDRCKRVSKESPLPSDYLYNTECNGYTMVERALNLSGIPKEYRGKTKQMFDTSGLSDGLSSALIQAFNNPSGVVNTGSNLAFMSPNKGTGKTFAGTIILNEYIYSNCMTSFDYENPMAMYVKFGQWANELRTQYQLKDEEYALRVNQKVAMMKSVPLLMLDDIGSGRITDFIRDITYDVIDHRKENELSTIFTTNLTEQQLNHQDCLGDMITSRLFFNTVVYELHGSDRRISTTRVFR